MTPEQFWYGDVRLLKVYRTAYIRNKHYTAWVEGFYNFEAHSKAISNGNRAKQSDPVQQYSQWKDPLEKEYVPKISKESREKKFRQSQASQNAWWSNMLRK